MFTLLDSCVTNQSTNSASDGLRSHSHSRGSARQWSQTDHLDTPRQLPRTKILSRKAETKRVIGCRTSANRTVRSSTSNSCAAAGRLTSCTKFSSTRVSGGSSCVACFHSRRFHCVLPALGSMHTSALLLFDVLNLKGTESGQFVAPLGDSTFSKSDAKSSRLVPPRVKRFIRGAAAWPES